jgi:hypothetical protein
MSRHPMALKAGAVAFAAPTLALAPGTALAHIRASFVKPAFRALLATCISALAAVATPAMAQTASFRVLGGSAGVSGPCQTFDITSSSAIAAVGGCLGDPLGSVRGTAYAGHGQLGAESRANTNVGGAFARWHSNRQREHRQHARCSRIRWWRRRSRRRQQRSPPAARRPDSVLHDLAPRPTGRRSAARRGPEQLTYSAPRMRRAGSAGAGPRGAGSASGSGDSSSSRISLQMRTRSRRAAATSRRRRRAACRAASARPLRRPCAPGPAR